MDTFAADSAFFAAAPQGTCSAHTVTVPVTPVFVPGDEPPALLPPPPQPAGSTMARTAHPASAVRTKRVPTCALLEFAPPAITRRPAPDVPWRAWTAPPPPSST